MHKKQAATISILAPVLDFLCQHAPFDQMAPEHIEFLAKRLKLGFYARGTAITEPGHGPVKRFYIIKQGRIRGETEQGGLPEDSAWELVAGECFPIGALLARRPARTVHRAVDDTFCFELDRDDFDKLLVKSTVFHDFCTRRMASLLDQALRGVQAKSATEVLEDTSFSAPLSSLIKRRPITCRPDSSIRSALERMNTERVDSIVITDERMTPLGIFTLHDLLSRVALPEIGLDTPIRQVMSARPLHLPPSAFAYEAALSMASQGFGHVCVVEEGRLTGVVTERDLFSLQRVGLANLSRAITRAGDTHSLATLGRDVQDLINQMLAQGVAVAQITQIVAMLNDHITRRAIELCVAETGKPSVPFTWLAFGSEGRHEQTLRADQDNGILFVTPLGKTAEDVRRELLPLARRINQSLADCGCPLCYVNIMASNPEYCLSLDEWKQRFRSWIEQGSPERLLKAAIFFDFRPLYGDVTPAEELRQWVIEQGTSNQRFLRQMAINALRNRPPLGLVRDFVVSSSGPHPNMLNLKIHGTAPFVDGARIIALGNRIHETNTLSRFRTAAEMNILQNDEAAAWSDAYSYIQLLRMRANQAQGPEGKPLENLIDPGQLNELDRRILKEAFRQARKLQTRIAIDYQL
ncbi:MAG: DUF294 nucleotidyltransferase-like domain-containing protein [Gammaproteobacteria bacterium]